MYRWTSRAATVVNGLDVREVALLPPVWAYDKVEQRKMETARETDFMPQLSLLEDVAT
jgi:hypothetical protein